MMVLGNNKWDGCEKANPLKLVEIDAASHMYTSHIKSSHTQPTAKGYLVLHNSCLGVVAVLALLACQSKLGVLAYSKNGVVIPRELEWHGGSGGLCPIKFQHSASKVVAKVCSCVSSLVHRDSSHILFVDIIDSLLDQLVIHYPSML